MRLFCLRRAETKPPSTLLAIRKINHLILRVIARSPEGKTIRLLNFGMGQNETGRPRIGWDYRNRRQVAGDGRTYWVDLRMQDQMAASSYRANLPTVSGKFQRAQVNQYLSDDLSGW